VSCNGSDVGVSRYRREGEWEKQRGSGRKELWCDWASKKVKFENR